MKDCLNHGLFLLSLIVLMFVGGFFVGCLHTDKPDGYRNVDTKLVRDTIYRLLPQPIREVRVEVPASIDTAKILDEYYTQRAYADTIVIPQFATITLRDTIFCNRLVGRMIVSEVWQPPIAKRFSLSVGAAIGRHTTSLSAQLRCKSNQIGLGYDFHNRGIIATYQRQLFAW